MLIYTDHPHHHHHHHHRSLKCFQGDSSTPRSLHASASGRLPLVFERMTLGSDPNASIHFAFHDHAAAAADDAARAASALPAAACGVSVRWPCAGRGGA